MKLTNRITESGIAEKLRKCLPSSIFNFICYVYGYIIFLFGGYRKILIKNKELKGISKGKRAFLLATGPSIKNENLKLLKNEDCFSVSNFFLHDDIKIINPKFHFFVPYHKPLILENYIEWLKLADKELPKETKIILGHSTKEYVDKYKLFPSREIYYLYLTQTPFKRNYNICRPIFPPHTGPQMIIPVLIYMGYSEIYLLGCDHNVLKSYGEDRKDFYDRRKDIRKNSADKSIWEKTNIINELESNLKMFKQYEYYKTIANKKGIEITNLSKESWLEVFEKKNFESILNNESIK